MQLNWILQLRLQPNNQKMEIFIQTKATCFCSHRLTKTLSFSSPSPEGNHVVVNCFIEDGHRRGFLFARKAFLF